VIRSRLLPVALMLFWLASCTPRAAPVSVAATTPLATPTPPRHEIRFALIGVLTNPNVWSLFDQNGYSYNNYAVRKDYWPSLFRLSVPGRQFETFAAGGMPTSVVQEGSFYTALVSLRSDLKWTDGSPFTAEDVAFTVNNVISFRLGFDWLSSYNPDWIDHAESLDAHTVKFYFKKQPNISMWQYGALQGPVVQKAYWSPRVAASVALLPASDLLPQIDILTVKISDLQQQLDALNASSASPNAIQQSQSDLNRVTSDLIKAQAGFDSAIGAARESLYALNDGIEPHLGAWQVQPYQNGSVVNALDPQFSVEHPGMDLAVYQLYPDEGAALSALLQGEVDVLLEPDGLSSEGVAKLLPAQKTIRSPDPRLRFLVFNPLISELADPALHQALACMLDQDQLTGQMQGQAAPLESFILPLETFWYNLNAPLPCHGLDLGSRLTQAVSILRANGYTWTQEPGINIAGLGLALPNGTAYPAISLLTPSSDNLRVMAASYVQQQARALGIPLTAYSVSPEQIDYSVFSGQNYDMALLGWKVGAYPGYLCDWFGDANPIHYDGTRLSSACEALKATSDLSLARQQVFSIQSILVQDLPFIPLYSGLTREAYQNLSYSFDSILGGLSGTYGVPTLAVPASQ
jgi:peptide/nickel transport system substrate-binding protein